MKRSHTTGARADRARSTSFLRSIAGIIALSSVACGAADDSDPGIGRSAQALGTNTQLYLRCNSTAWGVDDGSRLRPTADPNILELSYNVTQNYMLADGDSCSITETNQLNGWGTQNADYGPVGAQTVVVPGGATLQVGPQFRIRYPSLGSFKIRLNRSQGNFQVASATSSAPGLEWPNATSSRTSDPWLMANHDNIGVMKPRVLALNFVNAKTNAQMHTHLAELVNAIAEGTTPRGHLNPQATPFLQYQLSYEIDLRNNASRPAPPNYPYRNSTLYPREDPQTDWFTFDYEQLFTQDFANLMRIPDPSDPSRYLRLCELSERGLVHEVWIYGDGEALTLPPDTDPEVRAAEMMGIQPRYDANFQRLAQPLNRCAGNECFEDEDTIPAECTRTLRIGWVNHNRGVGCFMESMGHAFEGISRENTVPYYSTYFREFAGFDLNARYPSYPNVSWYPIVNDRGDRLTFSQSPVSSTANRVTWQIGAASGTIDNYRAVCGNAHFPPNAVRHYDIFNEDAVYSTCAGYRTQGGPSGGDPVSLISSSAWAHYNPIAPDCTGAWEVYWWQQFPSIGTPARDASGAQMKNWWPFLFY